MVILKLLIVFFWEVYKYLAGFIKVRIKDIIIDLEFILYSLFKDSKFGGLSLLDF